MYGLNFEDRRVRDLSQLFQAKTVKVVDDSMKKDRIAGMERVPLLLVIFKSHNFLQELTQVFVYTLH